MPTEEVERAAEADSGSRAGFEEHIAEDGTVEHLGEFLPLGIGFHVVSDSKDLINISSCKLFYADYVGAAKIHGLVKGSWQPVIIAAAK